MQSGTPVSLLSAAASRKLNIFKGTQFPDRVITEITAKQPLLPGEIARCGAQCTPASHAVFIPSFLAAAAAADRSMKVISAFQRENANKFSLIASCAKDRETKRRGREREGEREACKGRHAVLQDLGREGRKEGDILATLFTSSILWQS